LFGGLLAANAAGRVVGAWLFARTPLRRLRGRVLAANLLVQGGVLAVFCVVPNPVLGLAAFLVLGLPAGASQIALSSWVQTNTDREVRGRVFGTLTSFVQWLMPLGPILFGWLGSLESPRFSLLAAAATWCAGGAYIASSPAVSSME